MSDKQTHTFQFEGEFTHIADYFSSEFCGMKCTYYGRGSAVEHKEVLLNFVKDVAGGQFEDPQDAAIHFLNYFNLGDKNGTTD